MLNDMNMSRPESRIAGARRLKACWLLALVWLVSTVWASLSPTSPGGIASAGIQFVALLAFILIHASIAGGWRGALTFFAVLFGTSFVLEAISIATGVPFGFFEHHSPGPRPLDVPLVVPVGYAVFGWLAWSQTRSILSALTPASRVALFAAPLLGAFILAGYDYPWDAIGATVLKIHSYRFPSGLFGVPLLNFIGWIVTGWAAFQIFALVERRFTPAPLAASRGYLLLPPLIWLGMAGSYFLRFWTAPEGTASVAGRSFVIADIYEASAAISLPAMVLPALLAIIAIAAAPGQKPSAHD